MSQFPRPRMQEIGRGPGEPIGGVPLLFKLDKWRHRIPFWWWLTYDALVAVVILLGFFGFRDATLWVGFAVLGIAVVIDSIEFIVKRPSARAKLPDELRDVRRSLEATQAALVGTQHVRDKYKTKAAALESRCLVLKETEGDNTDG